MFFRRNAAKRREFAAIWSRKPADQPALHPLAEDMMMARLRPFEPRFACLWPWLAAR